MCYRLAGCSFSRRASFAVTLPSLSTAPAAGQHDEHIHARGVCSGSAGDAAVSCHLMGPAATDDPVALPFEADLDNELLVPRFVDALSTIAATSSFLATLIGVLV